MYTIQLNPAIPLITPKGPGWCWFITFPSAEYNILWTVAIDETGEIWTFETSKVRADKNITLGRLIDKKISEIKDLIK